MATQVSKSELHSVMKGTETTDGWDVLVSYNEENLNKFLQTVWSQIDRVTNVQFTHTVMVGAIEFLVDYDLKLSSPALKFERTNVGAWATLIMNVSGTSVPKRNIQGKLEIPAGKIQLEVLVPITAVTGEGVEKMTSTAPLHFDDNTKAPYYITFHFQNDQSNWKAKKIGTGDANADRAVTALNDAADKIALHFHKDISDLFTPQSFGLASQPGVLNVFISTKGGDRGPGSDGRQFLLKGHKDYVPIPTGFGSSIIISRHLILQQFILAELQKRAGAAHLAKTNAIKELGGTGSDNDKSEALIELRFDPNLVVTKQKQQHFAAGFGLDFEGFSVDFENHPVELEFVNNTAFQAIYRWKWSYKGIFTYWETGTRGATKYHANYDVKIPDNPRSVGTLQDDVIHWDIKFTKDDQPDGTKGDQNVVINTTLYEFDLKLPELDYFRTTNLFAPGKHMIDASEMMFPFDFVILGKVATPPKSR